MNKLRTDIEVMTQENDMINNVIYSIKQYADWTGFIKIEDLVDILYSHNFEFDVDDNSEFDGDKIYFDAWFSPRSTYDILGTVNDGLNERERDKLMRENVGSYTFQFEVMPDNKFDLMDFYITKLVIEFYAFEELQND